MLKKTIIAVIALVLVMACALPVMAFAETEYAGLKEPFSQTQMIRTLQEGDKGLNVMRVQKRLKYYGFYYYSTVNPSGVYGNTLRRAVIEFQQANGLKADGKVGVNTWALLISNTALKKSDIPELDILVKGSKGTEVKQMQERLIYYGYLKSSADGSFGSKTESAVKAFQKKNGLKVDGKIGADTKAALLSSTAVAATDPTFERIEKGDTGSRVEDVQLALRSYYYYTGAVNGVFDSDVEKAVINFQKSAGLTADGIVGEKTYNMLVLGNAAILNGGAPKRDLQRTMRGYDVYVLQLKLNEMNYLHAPTWGYYDNETVEAVKSFQKDNHITESGVCDIQVRRYIWPSETVPENEEKVGRVTVRKGDHGPAVADLQMRLKAAGYLLSSSDGIFGESTEKAVKALQKDYDLKVDGVCGKQTWQTLVDSLDNVGNATPSEVEPAKKWYTTPQRKLYAGCRGVAVTKLQQMLIQLGYLSTGDDDGKFGPATKTAVMDFQADAGIGQDGVVGAKTYVKLYEALGIN